MQAAPFPPTTTIPSATGAFGADVDLPAAPAAGVVVIVHDGRTSAVDRFIAADLVAAGYATILYDGHDPRRLGDIIEWAHDQLGLPIGIFGAGRGVSAARIAAAKHRDLVASLILVDAHLEPAALDRLIDHALETFAHDLGRAPATAGRLWLG